MSISRRKFIAGSGILTAGSLLAGKSPPIERLVEAIVRNTLNRASATLPTSNYILIAMPGAPSRWIFDQALNPSGETVTPSAMAATKYTIGADGRVSGASHQTMRHSNGTHVSALFGTNVGTVGGGVRPFSDLLDNMITVRGYGTGADGHPTNLAKQTFPLSSAGSIGGNVADHSPALFKAIQFPSLGPFSGYTSMKGTSLTVPGYGGNGAQINYLNQIFHPFGARPESTSTRNLRERYQDLIARAKGVLADSERAGSASVQEDHEQALAKIKTGIAEIKDQWGTLYAKYLAILEYAFKDRSTPGYTANPIVPPGDNGSTNTPWAVFANQGISVAAPNQDIRNWTNRADLSGIATTFALCEFVMTKGYCSTYEMSILQPETLELSLIRTTETLFGSPQSVVSQLVFDQHGTGVMTGIFLNSCLFRAVGGALLELISQLKAHSLFDKTLIHWTQEFGRLPRNDGSGADHGFDGMISSLFTGRHTTGPLVLGNILTGGTRSVFPESYGGCFGYKGLTSVNSNNVYLTPAHVASTAAILLNLPENPWQNVAEPLVTIENGVVRATASNRLVPE